MHDPLTHGLAHGIHIRRHHRARRARRVHRAQHVRQQRGCGGYGARQQRVPDQEGAGHAGAEFLVGGQHHGVGHEEAEKLGLRVGRGSRGGGRDKVHVVCREGVGCSARVAAPRLDLADALFHIRLENGLEFFAHGFRAVEIGRGVRGRDEPEGVVELAPVPFPEPVQRVLSGAFKFRKGGEVAVDDAVTDLEERVGELEGFAWGEPAGSVADEVDLGVCKAGDESEGTCQGGY
jgi:hypothetical protein